MHKSCRSRVSGIGVGPPQDLRVLTLPRTTAPTRLGLRPEQFVTGPLPCSLQVLGPNRPNIGCETPARKPEVLMPSAEHLDPRISVSWRAICGTPKPNTAISTLRSRHSALVCLPAAPREASELKLRTQIWPRSSSLNRARCMANRVHMRAVSSQDVLAFAA